MNKYCMTFSGGGTAATLTFTHNMGTLDVIVQAYEPTGESIPVSIVRDTNCVSLLFDNPPDYDVRVVVIG